MHIFKAFYMYCQIALQKVLLQYGLWRVLVFLQFWQCRVSVKIFMPAQYVILILIYFIVNATRF